MEIINRREPEKRTYELDVDDIKRDIDNFYIYHLREDWENSEFRDKKSFIIYKFDHANLFYERAKMINLLDDITRYLEIEY